jgi:hypothetical protein
MHLLHFRKGDKGAAMYSVFDVLYERLKRARERGDHAAVLILEGEIRKWVAEFNAQADARGLRN